MMINDDEQNLASARFSNLHLHPIRCQVSNIRQKGYAQSDSYICVHHQHATQQQFGFRDCVCIGQPLLTTFVQRPAPAISATFPSHTTTITMIENNIQAEYHYNRSNCSHNRPRSHFAFEAHRSDVGRVSQLLPTVMTTSIEI